MTKISKLFIANRGEIARRIASSARKMGIESACICDRRTPPIFLKEFVDHIIPVAKESAALFLNIEAMVDLAVSSGCQAVHPGFGFLSENYAFAQAVEKAGLIWIGPRPQTIAAMASKSEARSIAEQRGIPCTKGLTHIDLKKSDALTHIRDFAASVPFPLLIKAAYGGGGKGMRLVYSPAELDEACQRAYSEAENAFGNGTLIIEQYIERSRHIEVQILGDKKGQIYVLGDRDCSVQRRHQKIIEESPAPQLNDKTRQALHNAAKKLAEEVNYESAGTVEFLLDWSEKSRQKEDVPFYFLEMNTRLQVEHPVTEQVFGIDLVEWQLKIAMNEPLPSSFSQLMPRGHAIEARIYAENPEQNFLPSPGFVYGFKPYEDNDIRWEIGIDPIDEISSQFDPMIAKVIGYGRSREEAIRKLAFALSQTILAGPKNNLSYLQLILNNSPFLKASVDTQFISDFHHKLLQIERTTHEKLADEAAKILQEIERTHPIPAGGAFSCPADHLSHLAYSKKLSCPLTVSKKLVWNYSCSYFALEWDQMTVLGIGSLVLDHKSDVIRYAINRSADRKAVFLLWRGLTFVHEIDQSNSGIYEIEHGRPGEMHAPVPGKIIKITVEVGQNVVEHETLVVLESMKMEFQLKAQSPGIIESIMVAAGEQVQSGQCLIALRKEAN